MPYPRTCSRIWKSTSTRSPARSRTIGLVILRGAGGELLRGLRHAGSPRARPGARQAALSLGGHPETRRSAAAGHLRDPGPLLHGRAGARAGRGPDRRLGIGAVLRRVCALGADAGVGSVPEAAASYRKGEGERDDVHLPQLLGKRGAGHASREFLLPGRCLRGGAGAALRAISSPIPGTPIR